jgi:hypothetical protein
LGARVRGPKTITDSVALGNYGDCQILLLS